MANITDKTALGATPADGDKLYIVDVSDTTDNANGSDKHIVFSDLTGHLLKLSGGTMTGDIDMGGNDIDNGGVIFLTEQADANADVAGKGQIWVNTATPNELYFTDDVGTDSEILLPANTVTMTNKTIDGDNNTLSNLDLGNEVDWAAANDVTDRTAFASGDKLLIFEAGVGMRKIDYDDLPGGGGGLSNVVEDTTPQLGGQLDVNGNAIGDGTRELITFTEDASAVNHLNVENEATGSGPVIRAAGDDTNIDLNIQPKATGNVTVSDGTDTTKKVSFEVSGATTATATTLTASQTANRTVTLPDATDTLVGKATTDTLTNKTFDANGTGNSLSNVDVADLANGTDGELITWDAAGAPATVAAGTSGHVLTSNGAGAAPTFQAAAGGGSSTEKFTMVLANWSNNDDAASPVQGLTDTSTSGTGASATYGSKGWTLATGTTDGGRAGLHFDPPGTDNWLDTSFWDLNPIFNVAWGMNLNDGDNETFLGLGGNPESGTFDGTSQTIAGIKLVRSSSTDTWYAVSGNGTNETTTNITTAIEATQGFGSGSFNNVQVGHIVMNSGTDIKFYVNGTLMATHTTNLPSGALTLGTVSVFNVTAKNVGGTTDNNLFLYQAIAKIDMY